MAKTISPRIPNLKRHTIVKRRRHSWLTEYFCTSCQRELEQKEVNGRCKGARG